MISATIGHMTSASAVPAAIAFLLMIVFLVAERLLRRNDASRSLEKTEEDRGTTLLVGIAFAVSWLALLCSVELNHLTIATMHPAILFNIIGPAVMVCGIALRIVAAKTLGTAYTRTLQTSPQQEIIRKGIYKRIRHPGYLADIILFIGAGLCVDNWAVLLLIAIVVTAAYVRRISVEEQMLKAVFGEKYVEYAKESDRLVPFIF
jgi:protein-S-isoprenylcysteine O-methyltransferase Ste14